jgi:hypothetical protein
MLSVREINNIENLLDSFSQSLVEVLDTKDNDHRIYDFIDNSYLLNSYRDLFYYKLLSIQNVNFDARNTYHKDN